MTRTWKITDSNGTRRVTLEEFRAEMEALLKYTAAISDALRSGDQTAVEKAQKEMRKRFGVN